MNKDLQKRLEEAAVNITVDIIDRDPQPVYFAAIREAAFRGLEHGYKEATDKACEWLENWAKATKWYTIEESIEMLRKAMEG